MLKTCALLFSLMVSGIALSADLPVKKGEKYLFGKGDSKPKILQVMDVKGNWILINDPSFCYKSNNRPCWFNADRIFYIAEI